MIRACSIVQQMNCRVIACDGVWDVRTTEQAVAVINHNPRASCQAMAQRIIQEAYDNGSIDNISALVVELR